MLDDHLGSPIIIAVEESECHSAVEDEEAAEDDVLSCTSESQTVDTIAVLSLNVDYVSTGFVTTLVRLLDWIK
jgi:hypothetical protein